MMKTTVLNRANGLTCLRASPAKYANMQQRVRVRVSAEAHSQGSKLNMVLTNARRSTRILPLLSELTAIRSISTSFETLAGRSAMTAFIVATVFETAGFLGREGLFGQLLSQASTFAGVGISLVAFSALLATISTGGLGKELLEAVTTSLTSKARSRGNSITNKDVDQALDSAMDAVFNSAFISRNFFVRDDLVSVMSEAETSDEEF